jgi:RND superfamily putative drug exporter
MNFGDLIYKFRWAVLAAWVGAAVVAAVFLPSPNPCANEMAQFLPAQTDYRKAVDAMEASFHAGSLSQAVVVFEKRSGQLTEDDRKKIEAFAKAVLQSETEDPKPCGTDVRTSILTGVSVRSPGKLAAELRGLTAVNPLISDDHHAALVMISIPASFITVQCDQVVQHIYRVLGRMDLGAGMTAAVTGSAGVGHDYASAALRSEQSTYKVTLVAVIVILLLVYRAPLAAMIPLGAVSLAALLAMKLLGFSERFGMHTGTAEHIFVFVLVYGAGVDYTLLLVSRYRELIGGGVSHREAASGALNATLPAIAASAGTNIVGLFMLVTAQFGIFRTTGPAVALALAVALAAAITLVPAAIGIIGPRMFWPYRLAGLRHAVTARAAQAGLGNGRHAAPGANVLSPRWSIWPGLAKLIVARPALVAVVTLAVLAPAIVRGSGVTWVYDTLAAIKPEVRAGSGNGAMGAEMARRHWPVGEIAPVKLLVESDQPLQFEQWMRASSIISQAAAKFDNVCNVRSVSWPLGKESGQHDTLLGRVVGSMVDVPREISKGASPNYLSSDGKAMRMDIVLNQPPLTLEAMEEVRQLRENLLPGVLASAGSSVVGSGAGGKPRLRAHILGTTAEMIDTRGVTSSDFHRVAVLVLAVILVMVTLLLKDVILAAFMVGCTLLSYLTTLGITSFVFGWLGEPGLDWKVQIFLFVVIAAVGVDYNIFLGARLAQEARGRIGDARQTARDAVRLALAHTGPVISSCGLIMAATLGSLMAGELKLLHELGFALAAGMLIDTFVTRPLLLPAFVAITGRTGKAAVPAGQAKTSVSK